jgi:3,4-dihydroxy 2-butanone 4-phosphate synthase / GTP cyclohydrolase II
VIGQQRTRRPQDAVEAAIEAVAMGRPALLVDDIDSPHQGYAVVAAELAGTHWTSWLIRHASGWLCLPLPAWRADQLGIPLMAGASLASGAPAYCVGVDAAEGVGTGISALDRAHTARVVADRQSTPADLTRPGHVLPIRTYAGGTRIRCRPAEAAVDLCQLAGMSPVALSATLITDGGSVMSGPQIAELARKELLPKVDVSAVASACLSNTRTTEERVVRTATTALPTRGGLIDAISYRDLLTGAEHVVLRAASAPTLSPRLDVLTECAAGQTFSANDCTCRHDLDSAMESISRHQSILVYLRPSHSRLISHNSSGDEIDMAAAAAILIDLGYSQNTLRSSGLLASKLLELGILVECESPHQWSSIVAG